MVENSGHRTSENLQAVAKVKLHEQIFEQVQLLIEKGRLKHGDQLPPERELAAIFKVSRHRYSTKILSSDPVRKHRFWCTARRELLDRRCLTA
jgi:GntR family transcriptional repressor for pyruvate dehydrogenase complex